MLNYAIGMRLFRTDLMDFPIPACTLNIAPLRSSFLATCKGSYTRNYSAAVSKKQKVPPGVYILVPTTFDPGQFGSFEATLYTADDVMEVEALQHVSSQGGANSPKFEKRKTILDSLAESAAKKRN